MRSCSLNYYKIMENVTADTRICPRWLYSIEWQNTTTIKDINHEVMTRNIPGLVFVSILMVIGIFGNTTVMYVFWTKYTHSNYRTYILCLGFVDEISSCISMPFILVYLSFPKNFPSNALCKFGHFIGFYANITSALLLVLIAIDRYRKICQPLKKQITKRFAKRCCVIINIVALLISVQAPMIYGTSTRPTGILDIKETTCFIDASNFAITYGKVFYIQLQVITGCVILLLTVLYSKIMKTLKTQRRKSEHRLNLQSSVSKLTRHRNTTCIFVVITVIFSVSSEIHHALAMIVHFVDNFECSMNRNAGAVFYAFLWAVLINNATNPFIYGVSDERFRRYFKQLINRRSVIREWTQTSNTER